MSQPFRPTPWLAHHHVQTLLPSLGWVRAPDIRWDREVFRLPDSDTVALDWHPLPPNQPPTAVLVILHGLEGSSESSYARGIADEAYRRGWLSVVLHARDCGGHPNTMPRRYHAGETSDPGGVFDVISDRYANIPLFACGYSLGGNTLLKYLGERGGNTPIRAAAAVSVPFDLQGAADSVSYGFSKLYQWYLMRNMKKSLVRKFGRDPVAFDLAAALRTRTFEEFDDMVTAPMHGFTGKDHYYSRCSSKQFMRDIRVPTTVIHALDDPFISRSLLPTDGDISDSVTLEYTEHGGHVGFVKGPMPGKLSFWLPERLCWHSERMSRPVE